MSWFNDVETEWRDAVTRWAAAVDNMQIARQLHLSNETKARDLGPKEFAAWEAQLENMYRVQAAVDMLQDAIGGTSSWARDTFGLDGIKRGIAGMGFIPLIPVAVIIGSISAVTAVTYALNSYNAELQRKWDYVNKNPNMTPQQVEDLINGGGPVADVVETVGGMAGIIVIGGLLLYFGPTLLKQWKGK